MTTEYCRHNMETLSKVKKGDKLYYYNNQFVIDYPSYTQSLMRWYYAESRHHTIKQLEEFTNQVLMALHSLLPPTIRLTNYYSNVLPPSSSFAHGPVEQFITAMKGFEIGLQQLKETYVSDESTASSCEILIGKIHVRVKKAEAILQATKKEADPNLPCSLRPYM